MGLQLSFRTDVGLSQCSTGRKRVSQHICETTGITRDTQGQTQHLNLPAMHILFQRRYQSYHVLAVSLQPRWPCRVAAMDSPHQQWSQVSDTQGYEPTASSTLLKLLTLLSYSFLVLCFSGHFVARLFLVKQQPSLWWTTSLFEGMKADQMHVLNAPETPQQQVCTSRIMWAWMTGSGFFF